MGKGVAEGIQARHIGVCPRFFPFFPLDGTPEMEPPANVNLQGFRSISRRVGDSNPRYSNPVRQFSKLVYGKNICTYFHTLQRSVLFVVSDTTKVSCNFHKCKFIE